jgi:hypothetical protein
MAAKKHKQRELPRPFALHWGSGVIAEEATCRSEYHEPAIQLLEFDEGYVSIRFCYYDLEGRFQRSPLIVGDDSIAALRQSLKQNPKLLTLLKKLVSD